VNVNVAENRLLQQMQQMQMAMDLPQAGGVGGSKEDSSSFQEMMDQAAQDAPVDTGKDQPTAGKPVQDKEDGGGKAEDTQEDGETFRPQDLHGNPNAVAYVPELFRPEIVDVSETAVEGTAAVELAEAPVVTVAVEDGGAPAEILPQEDGVSVQEEDAPVQEVQPEFHQALADADVPKAERQTEITTETEEPVQTVETAVEEAPEKPVETPDASEVKVVRHSEKAAPQDDTPETQGEPSAEVSQPVFHEVKDTPVKVGETYETVDAQSPDMDEKLAGSILRAAQSGEEAIQIQLSPANLGRLTIDMTRDASGALQIVLHAASGKTAGLLREHLDGLHAALQSSGQGQEVHVEVQRNQESQEQRMFQHADPDGRGQQQRQRHQEERHDSQQQDSEDFLQRLRLGLTSRTDAI